MRFKDKVCFVTGGGSGIGRATCERFAAEGGKVVVVKRCEKSGSETVAAIEGAGGQAIFVSTDVSVPEQVERAMLVRTVLRVNQTRMNHHDPDTSLMRAIITGDPVVVRDLLAKGADPNVKDSAGLTALMWAAGNGHLDAVQALLVAKADVNATSAMGKTALMFAARSGHTAIVMGLLMAGVDRNAKDENGATALMIAQRHNRAEIVKLLQ